VLDLNKMKCTLPAVRILWVIASLATSASASDLKSLLKNPVSPAGIALLAPFSRDPQVVARWKSALSDGNPDVRGVAARAINTCGVAELLGDVTAALSRETDAAAAREEVRAIILLGRGEGDEAALAAGGRFSGLLDAAIVRAFARARGLSALPLFFARLRNLNLSEEDRAAFFRLATRGNESRLGAASMALGRQDAQAWRAVLAGARRDPALAKSAVVKTAIASTASVFRGEAAWFLAKEYCEDRQLADPDLLSTLRAAESADPAIQADPESAFGEELLRRILGETPVENQAWIACLRENEHCHLDSDLRQSKVLAYLTPGEREAMDQRNQKNLPADLRKKREASTGGGVSPAEKAGRDLDLADPVPAKLWSVSELPKGLGKDLLEAASCGGLMKGSMGVAEISYRTDGRPAEVTILSTPSFSGCSRILRAVFLLTLAPPNEPTTEDYPLVRATILVPGVLAAAEESDLPLGSSVSPNTWDVRGRVKPPILRFKKEPVYPPSAVKNHIQGLTIIQAVVSEKGFAKELRVVKSVSPLLDLASLLAVSQWTYEPAQLDGRPVPVYLTVSVNFQLR